MHSKHPERPRAEYKWHSLIEIPFLVSIPASWQRLWGKSCPYIAKLLPFWCILWVQWQLGGNCPGQSCCSSNPCTEPSLCRTAKERPVELQWVDSLMMCTSNRLCSLCSSNIQCNSAFICRITGVAQKQKEQVWTGLCGFSVSVKWPDLNREATAKRDHCLLRDGAEFVFTLEHLGKA